MQHHATGSIGSLTVTVLPLMMLAAAYWFAFASCGGGTSPCVNCPPLGLDTIPPDIAVISPAANATVGNRTEIQFTATDNFGVTRIELVVNDTVVSVDTVPPFTATLDVTGRTNAESLFFRLRAYDFAGLVDSSFNRTVHARWSQCWLDSDEALPHDMKGMYIRSTASELHLRIETHRPWGDRARKEEDVFCGIFFDTDQSSLTGARSVSGGTIAINDIGADYRAIVGPQGSGDSLGIWVGAAWGSLRPIETLRIQDNDTAFEFAVRLSDFGNPALINWVAANVQIDTISSLPVQWDWSPNSSHLTYSVDKGYIGPPL